ncbi:MAG: biotin--[acetyl-CoA-carboxylase] ligase [Puniceicoccales bacterium]|jgi:BirA family biotin operon repressor/biotin-[acetyl-CoA-carboxylase] ligase|nr:biotin--[acetyl-CoA-carboxylase] ligase [Puniceicoccales bacterium]
MEIFHYGSIDSTNSECFRKFDAGQCVPFAVIAETQTQGRGQFDRKWYSADSKNLYISFGFIPRQLPQEFQNYSIIVAKKIADRLGQIFDLIFETKAPNDICFNGKKLCGILTESRIAHGRIIFAVTGIGLNVAGDLSSFPLELQTVATTLGDCCKRAVSCPAVATVIVEVMEKLLLGSDSTG